MDSKNYVVTPKQKIKFADVRKDESGRIILHFKRNKKEEDVPLDMLIGQITTAAETQGA